MRTVPVYLDTPANNVTLLLHLKCYNCSAINDMHTKCITCCTQWSTQYVRMYSYVAMWNHSVIQHNSPTTFDVPNTVVDYVPANFLRLLASKFVMFVAVREGTMGSRLTCSVLVPTHEGVTQ